MSREEHLKISCHILSLFLKEIMKDGKIEPHEKEGFLQLVEKLSIPSDMAKKTFDTVKASVVADANKGAIDYRAFFGEMNTNLSIVLKNETAVNSIMDKVASLLGTDALSARSFCAEAAPENTDLCEDAIPQEVPVTQPEPAIDATLSVKTVDLGNGIYNPANDKVVDGFEYTDIDMTHRGLAKGGM